MSTAPALGQYDHMVHSHYLDRVRRLHTERDGRLSKLSTAEDAVVRVFFLCLFTCNHSALQCTR